MIIRVAHCMRACDVRFWSQVSVMCDDHYCHTPAPLLQLTLPMQMSLIASPRPSPPPSRQDNVHLLDLIKVMREGGVQEEREGWTEENWETENERSWLKKKKERKEKRERPQVTPLTKKCYLCVCSCTCYIHKVTEH